ncbi:hypothetical protein EV181_003106, partial [Coemansia sp. RSA 532]
MTINRFCPNSEGWGPWSTERELDLTMCFERGVAFPVLDVFFLIISAIRLRELQAHVVLPNINTKTTVFWTKLLLAGAIAVGSVVELYYLGILTTAFTSIINALVVGQLIHIIAFVVATVLCFYEQTKARGSSGILLLYWLVTIMLSLITLRTDRDSSSALGKTTDTLPLLRYGLVVMMASLFCMELWPRRESEYMLPEDDGELADSGAKTPEESANIFSRLTFSWMSPLLRLGRHKGIDESDLWPLPTKYSPVNVAETFELHWEAELGGHSPSLLRALWKTTGLPYALAGLLKLVQDILQFTQPVLLSRLIGFVASYATSSPQPVSWGYFYAFSMLFLQLIQTLVLHQYFQLGMTTGMKAKSSLTSAIYKKALRLSNETRQEYTTGSITTLFSVDVERIGGVVDYAHIAWSRPLQICFAMWLLYRTLGWSVFAGIVVMVVTVPLNAWLTKRMRDLQIVQMKNKDKRTMLIDETLSGIKVIKLYAWERSFLQRIQHVREALELSVLSAYGRVYAWSSVSMMVVPFMVSFVTYLVYSVFDGESRGPLTAQLVFVSLSLFNLLQFPLIMFPVIISALVEASVAMNRVYRLLTSDELDPSSVTRLTSTRVAKAATGDSDVVAVRVRGASFRWSTGGPLVLDNINFSANSNEHLAVLGRVGAGKSSLASALLGDMRLEQGDVAVHGSVAYAPQQPWIMNATLRDNILFGLKYDEAFYIRVIDACALRPDLDMLAAGDLTEIGEKGINLSGGQKARVSLARAVYARADVYILDDPLSAVDAHVGRHLFEHVLGPNGLLRSRCRIHVTNAISFVSKCDSALVLRNATVAEHGPIGELLKARGQVYNLIQEYGSTTASSPSTSSDITPNASAVQLDNTLESAEKLGSFQDITGHRTTIGSLPPASIASLQQTGHLQLLQDSGDNGEALMTKEVSAVGKVSLAAYVSYFRACSWSGTVLFIGGVLLCQAALVLSNVWLKVWASANEAHERSGTSDSRGPLYYIAVYGLFGVVAAAFCYLRAVVQWCVCVVRSGRVTHRQMLQAVLRSPTSFFDTTPLGRILQRFSKDMNSVDEVIPRTIGSWLVCIANVLLSLLVIVVSLPAFAVVVVPVLVFFFYLKNYFLDTSRTLKRLDSTTRSPIYAGFQESLAGASTIRAYGLSARFMAENVRKVDANQRCVYPYLSLNRWLAVRLEFMSAFIIFSTALLGVVSLLYGTADAGLVGLTVTYALQSTQQINWMLRMECDLENSMCDYVRIQEFEQLQPEAADVIEDHRPHATWPHAGQIEFKNYSMRYRSGLDLVLNDVSFVAKPREKIGIVGRTGAGKSSLTLALFRIIEAASGQILLDGEDIAKYGLFDVRSKLSIIPQDPVLFAGTVRDNLDPFNEYSDQEIWQVLDHAHLAEFVRSKDERLEFVVAQSGENFSVGQRQLICLARALLKRAKVLVLDEATAAIDPESDAVIQESIRKEFKDCT